MNLVLNDVCHLLQLGNVLVVEPGFTAFNCSTNKLW